MSLLYMMLNFLELLFNPTGRILISIIWGLGLAALFKSACKHRNCQVIQYKGPNPEEVKKSYYKYGKRKRNNRNENRMVKDDRKRTT